MPTTSGTKHGLGVAAAPFIRTPTTTPRLMLYVCAALLPGLAVTAYFWGSGVLWQAATAAAAAAVCELLACLLRRRSPWLALSDCSWLVTALLLALTLPPLTPWHYTAGAAAFAILVVKHCFGGLGMNVFNPAMAGFIFLMISAPGIFFATSITPGYATWSTATPQRTFAVIFTAEDPAPLREEIWAANAPADLISGATYLETFKNVRKAGHAVPREPLDFLDPERTAFHAYAYLGAAWVLGGLALWLGGVILLQQPLFFLATVAACGMAWHALQPETTLSLSEHLLCGGTLLAAFYIITDPVTSCGTARGRIALAVLCGALVVLNRALGSYADSVAFAVLLANCCGPLIDVLTRRRPFGAGYDRGLGLK